MYKHYFCTESDCILCWLWHYEVWIETESRMATAVENVLYPVCVASNLYYNTFIHFILQPFRSAHPWISFKLYEICGKLVFRWMLPWYLFLGPAEAGCSIPLFQWKEWSKKSKLTLFAVFLLSYQLLQKNERTLQFCYQHGRNLGLFSLHSFIMLKYIHLQNVIMPQFWQVLLYITPWDNTRWWTSRHRRDSVNVCRATWKMVVSKVLQPFTTFEEMVRLADISSLKQLFVAAAHVMWHHYIGFLHCECHSLVLAWCFLTNGAGCRYISKLSKSLQVDVRHSMLQMVVCILSVLKSIRFCSHARCSQ